MLWQRENETRPPLAWVTQTRRGHGYLRKPDDSVTSYVVDFEGPALRKLPPDAPVEARVHRRRQRRDRRGQLLSQRGDRRLARDAALQARIDEKKPVELRAFLRHDNVTLSETWSYVLPPT